MRALVLVLHSTLLPLLLSALLSALCGGCAARTGPYAPALESARDPLRAQALTLEAADLVETDPGRAERLLRQALSADLYHGPAHNNLGVLYLAQGKLYEAAGEFEWARKLLPGHPDPRVNLALTLERAGRTDDALAAYAAALEVYPDYLPAQQGLVRLQIRAGRRDDRTPRLLAEVALRGDEQWREWALLHAARP